MTCIKSHRQKTYVRDVQLSNGGAKIHLNLRESSPKN